MERHKYTVETGEYVNGSGAWTTDTNQRFDLIVECTNSVQGISQLQAQYGGQDRCRVTWRGPA